MPVKRPHQVIYYPETYKMLLRGALFNAPHSLRESFRETLEPITLGGDGAPNEIIGVALKEKEIHRLESMVRKMQRVKVPECDPETGSEAAQDYVNEILAIADKYIHKLDYFQCELETITGNIRSRRIVLQNPDAQTDKAHAFKKAIQDIKQGDSLTAEAAASATADEDAAGEALDSSPK